MKCSILIFSNLWLDLETFEASTFIRRKVATTKSNKKVQNIFWLVVDNSENKSKEGMHNIFAATKTKTTKSLKLVNYILGNKYSEWNVVQNNSVKPVIKIRKSYRGTSSFNVKMPIICTILVLLLMSPKIPIMSSINLVLSNSV